MFGHKNIKALEAKAADLSRRWGETLLELNQVRRERDEARALLAKRTPSTQDIGRNFKVAKADTTARLARELGR